MELFRIADSLHRVLGLAAARQRRAECWNLPAPTAGHAVRPYGEIEAEQAPVRANRELTPRFKQKIQTTLARSWENVLLIFGIPPQFQP
jgi:hypothetical protein